MAQLNFTLNDLGYQNRAVYTFDTPNDAPYTEGVTLPVQAQKGNGSIRLDTGSKDAQIVNWLGLPVFCSARLINPDDATDILELLTIVIEVTTTRNIDIVNVQGLDGTIKFYVNEGDYSIRIKGMLTTDNGDDFPLEDTKKLIRFLKMKKSINIACDYLALFDVHTIAVLDFSFPQLEGNQNTQIFDINCLSDFAVELLQIID